MMKRKAKINYENLTIEELERLILKKSEENSKHHYSSRILFYLIIMSIAFTVVSFSMYATSVSGSDSAKVADYVFNCMGENNSAITLEESGWQPGQSRDYNIIINNVSGVRVCLVEQDYTMEVGTTGNLPLVYTLSYVTGVGSGTPVITEPVTLNFINGKATFNTGKFLAGDVGEHRYLLNITWPQNIKNVEYMYEIDSISLKVSSVQVI